MLIRRIMNYAKVVTSFWTGDTGLKISKLGSSYVQLLSCYLVCNKHAHMTGIYHLPIGYVVEDLSNLTYEEVTNGVKGLIDVGYCKYDFDKKYIWVENMLKYQVGEKLTAGNKQTVAINRYVDSIGSMRLSFFDEFMEKYMESHCIVDTTKI